jgi:PBSX family phage terminase large subunit
VNLDALPLSRKQIVSIVEAQRTEQLALWTGAVAAGKTIASLIAFLIALPDAPQSGIVCVVGRTLQTIERNLIDPLQDERIFGSLAEQVHHTAGSNTAVILGRTVHLIGASDVRAEGRIRGVTVALAYVDEATLLPEAFWVMMMSRLRVAGAKLFATTNPANPGHWLRRDYILRAADVGLRHWHFTLDDNPGLPDGFVERLKRQYTGLFYKRFILGQWIAAEGAVYDMWDEDRHVTDLIPPITQWLCAAVDYGTTNPFHAVLLGIGAEADPRTGARRECLYGVSEWRWDSRQRHRQLTDVEYSVKLREWLHSVRFPGTHLHGPSPQYLVIDPSAASFKLQAYQDGWNVADGDNSVLDGIRLVSSLLARDRLKLSRSGCPALIEEFPAYCWDDKAALAGEDKVVKVADHGLDALRYGTVTTRNLWHNRILLAA